VRCRTGLYSILAVLGLTLLGAQEVASAPLAEPAPVHEGYERLEQALERYRRIAGLSEPEPVPPGPALKPGAEGDRVALLRARLAAAAEAEAADPLPETELPEEFDFYLEEAVRAFQERHGLQADGIAGASTLAELNRTAEEQIRKIEVNLERWHLWHLTPADLGERHILVNIAAFRLHAIEDGRSVLDMRVIVGRTDTPTPVGRQQRHRARGPEPVLVRAQEHRLDGDLAERPILSPA
jgi:L,D-transpeptidase YcbB